MEQQKGEKRNQLKPDGNRPKAPRAIQKRQEQIIFVQKTQTAHYLVSRPYTSVQVSDAKTSDSKKSEWEDLDAISENGNQAYSSVCDIWKESVHKIITKAEYQTPIYLQAYSMMHSEFLHSVDNLFGTCYIWQKRYFDRIGIDQKVVNAYGELCEKSTNGITEWMDVYANYKKFQADLIIDYMKIGNNYLNWWIDMYGKALSFWKF